MRIAFAKIVVGAVVVSAIFCSLALGSAIKPLHYDLPQGYDPYHIEVKFLDDLDVGISPAGKPFDRSGSTLNSTPATAAFDEIAVKGGIWRRATGAPEAKLDELRMIAERNAGRPLADMNNYFVLRVPENINIENWIDMLNKLDDVEIATAVPLPMPAPLPPNWVGDQWYLDPAPGGVDAEAAWGEPGGTGANVTICDVEYSWNFNHLDLPGGIPVWNTSGMAPLDPYDFNHGTAVLGVLASLNNGWGTTGAAYDANIAVAPSNFDDGSTEGIYLPHLAIQAATANLTAGDVILLEQQIAGPNYVFDPADPLDQDGLVALEWDEASYDAIVIAVGNGIHVVAAAGNGAENLDAPEYSTGHGGHWPFLPANNSGSIMVGAGAPPPLNPGDLPDRSRVDFSNYGSIVDVQNYGWWVLTTGYGDHHSEGGNANLDYTWFSGTSSASAVTAATVGVKESIYEAGCGLAMAPAAMRSVLVLTGSPQQDGPLNPATQHIGPRPNLGITAPGSPSAVGADVVYIIDQTGSTDLLRGIYKNVIAALTTQFEAANNNCRFALAYFMDFPFSTFGVPTIDVAYAVQTDFVDDIVDLQPFIDNLPDGIGYDPPESQYTAVHQAISGTGVDLNGDGDFIDEGEVAPTPLSYGYDPLTNPNPNPLRAYFLFTWPDEFHDSDVETDYPKQHAAFPGAATACSRTDAIEDVLALGDAGMLFGFTITDLPKGSYQQYDRNDKSRDRQFSLSVDNPLAELADTSGGRVFYITQGGGNEAELAVEAFTEFYDKVFVTNQPATIRIEKTHDTYQGHYAFVSITLEALEFEMGGFDFLIAYDASALTFMEATPGQLLEDCGWEYFTYRYGVEGNCGDACPSGLLRIIAMAETNNGPNHPSCYGPPDDDPHELAEMKFYVTNDFSYECQYVPIRFFWDDCGDNSVSSVDGEMLYVSDHVYDFDGNEVTGDIFYGGQWSIGDCMNPDPHKPSVIPFLDFYHGGVDIVCVDSIDARGDINLNNVANEISDAVLLTNYFIYGLGVFYINPDGQIAATDVNNDGRVLTVGDLVYLVRIITGDALPYPKLAHYAHRAIVDSRVDGSVADISVNSEADIGAGYFVFDYAGYEIGRPELTESASDMSLKYSAEDGVLKVLVYSYDKGVMIAAGSDDIFTIPISGSGSIELVQAELSDYYGNLLTASLEKSAALPTTYELHQNYPNPFNATTRIMYEMPVMGHVTIEIYNITGQKVTTLVDGIESAGVHSVLWDGRDSGGSDVASGIYFYRLTGDDFTDDKKMVLLK